MPLSATAALRHDERGFTMVTMMGVLLFVVALVFTTYSVADGDLAPAKKDEDRKIAYAAAEAGIQNFVFHLLQNDDYWAKCTNVPEPHAINQRWDGTGTDTRTKWLNVPESGAQYAIELLPANGNSSCTAGDTASMVDSATGTLRIRATGRTSNEAGAVRRSIVASMRRENFLDYIYFTDLETQAPAIHEVAVAGLPTLENPRTGSPTPPQRDFVQWAAETCAQTYWHQGRGALRFKGEAINNAGLFYLGAWNTFNRGCININFFGPTAASPGDAGPTALDTDAINGPLHSNDEILVCGHPRFGRFPQDKVEVSGPARPLTGSETPATVGWRRCASDPASAPNVNFPGESHSKLGTWIPNARTLTLPASNTELRADTAPGYRFVGRTIVKLDGTHMYVTGKLEDGTAYDNSRIALPADGVLYVSNDNCGATYKPLPPYPDPVPPGTGCGDLEVEGTYGASVTLGAQNDIVVTEDILKEGGFAADADDPVPGPDVLLGLISNTFVRVYHPVKDVVGTTCANDGGPAPDVRIDAAILSVGHSFMHDFYFCGAPTGTLTVNGAVGQKYRGVVSTSNDGVTLEHGFKKNYVYDDRLKFRSPPHFVDPVGAGWQVQTYAEQVPAR